MSDWQNYKVEEAENRGQQIDLPLKHADLASEAEADRAAGLPTVGTRGYADTKAFENGN